MLRDFARAAEPRLQPGEIVVRELGGGVALYLGAGNPANKVAGLGFGPVPTAAELDSLEQAFAERGAPLQAEISSLGDPEIGKLLTGRGYRLVGFENLLGLGLAQRSFDAPADSRITVSAATSDEAADWMDALLTGFMNPDTFDGPPSHESFDREAIERIFADAMTLTGFERYVARWDGEIAGGASFRLQDGIAQLAGAATKPEFRRRGIQSALLRYRLQQAASRGADMAVVTTQPGSKSTQNVQRFGFSILYARAVLVKSAP